MLRNMSFGQKIMKSSCAIITGAEPSDIEKDVYASVDAVLSKAAGIVEELKSYQGAGEAIRNVGGFELIN